MSSSSDWLPDLMLEEHYPDWDTYEAALFQTFFNNFHVNPPSIKGMGFRLLAEPKVNGRHHTFWHFISVDTYQGCPQEKRVIRKERCERIGWARAILDKVGTDEVCAWKEIIGGHARPHIALPDFSYLVVLELRTESATGNSYAALVTAHDIEYPRQREHLRKRWEKYRKKPPASP